MRPVHVILVSLISLAAFAFLYHKTADSYLVKEEQQKKAKELFLGKRLEHSAPAPADKVFPGCEELETTLNDLDFRLPADQWLTTLELLEIDQCEDPKLEAQLKRATESCFSKKVVHQDCVTQLIFLRSYLRTRVEADANDLQNAADMIIREFGSQPPDFVKMNAYAEKLLDSDPGNVNFQKIWAVSKFISAIMKDKTKFPEHFEDDLYARLDPSIVQSLEFQPFRFFLENAGSPLEGESFAREFVSAYPKHSQAHEVLGWSLWQQGRKEEAMASLQQAMKYNPKDPFLKETYAKLQSRNATKEAYQGRLHMGMNLNDLFD